MPSAKIPRPSPWVCRFAPLVPAGGTVLDLACGSGRHARHFLSRGHRVVAIDRNVDGVSDLEGVAAAEVIRADLEGQAPWHLAGRRFAGVVVVKYLHRPLLPDLLDALEAGGVLIYETFARGNERYRRPRKPDFLLRRGELLEWVSGKLQVVAYEHGIEDGEGSRSVVQRICAVNDLT